MKVIQSAQGGHCPLCDQDTQTGDPVCNYLSSWCHETCVISDCLTRSDHSEGVTYFLELQQSRVKVGFSGTEKGAKQRIRRAHLDLGGATRVLGLFSGGQTLEFRMHYIFQRYSTEINEVFFGHPHLLATARQGASHPYMPELKSYLEKLKEQHG